MPRAKRYHISGYVWHITHRCHKREYLLRFARDRRRWIHWLFEAKKRYGISILNYMVTSNHIHLLVYDSGDRMAIPNAMQLIAGRTAQEFNQRKNRNGAFWQDRYHATAVESGNHFRRCLVYIDMNMVRAGVVAHPSDWPFCGFNEIQQPKQRYSLIDHTRLHSLAGSAGGESFRTSHLAWVGKSLRENGCQREDRWTESIAVGGKKFVENVKEMLGYRARGRGIIETAFGAGFELKDPVSAYNTDFGVEMGTVSDKNSYIWGHKNMFSAG